MQEKYLYSDIKNWNRFSNKTKDIIHSSGEDEKDIIEYLVEEKYTALQLVQMFQSLADPSLMGLTKNRQTWNTLGTKNAGYITQSIEPYYSDDASYNSLALSSNSAILGDLQLPLSTSYSPDKKLFTAAELRCPRFDELVHMYASSLGLDLTIEVKTRDNQSFYKLTDSKNGKLNRELTIYLSSGDVRINEYEALVLINDMYAGKYIDEFINSSDEIKATRAKYSSSSLKYIDGASRTLATLLITRATFFNNPEVQYKIDEALKLQLASNLALVDSEGKEPIRLIVKQALNAVKEITFDMNLSPEFVIKNMTGMGFEYRKNSKEIKSVLEALVTASNFEERFGLEKIQILNDFDFMDEDSPAERASLPNFPAGNNPLVIGTLSNSALSGGPCLTRLENILPSYMFKGLISKRKRNQILESKGRTHGLDPATYVNSALKGKYNDVFVNAVLTAFSENVIDPITQKVLSDYEENFYAEGDNRLGASQRLKKILFKEYADNEEKAKGTTKCVTAPTLIKRAFKKEVERVKAKFTENNIPVRAPKTQAPAEQE